MRHHTHAEKVAWIARMFALNQPVKAGDKHYRREGDVVYRRTTIRGKGGEPHGHGWLRSMYDEEGMTHVMTPAELGATKCIVRMRESHDPS
jgi:hypothetical protein